MISYDDLSAAFFKQPIFLYSYLLAELVLGGVYPPPLFKD